MLRAAARPIGRSRPEELLALARDEVRIGRGTENEIVLPDFSVSRRHAALRRESEGWALARPRRAPTACRSTASPSSARWYGPGDKIKVGIFELHGRGGRGPSASLIDSAPTSARRQCRRRSRRAPPPSSARSPTSRRTTVSTSTARGAARARQAQGARAGVLEQDLRLHDPAGAPADPLRLGGRGAVARDRPRLRGAARRPRLHPAARRDDRRAGLRAGAHQGPGRAPAAGRGAGVAHHGRAGDARARRAAHLRRAVRPAARRRRVDPHPPDPLGDVRAALVGREDHRRACRSTRRSTPAPSTSRTSTC